VAFGVAVTFGVTMAFRVTVRVRVRVTVTAVSCVSGFCGGAVTRGESWGRDPRSK
jgi:hypothetical protein